jgi:hypothetical protein
MAAIKIARRLVCINGFPELYQRLYKPETNLLYKNDGCSLGKTLPCTGRERRAKIQKS